MKTERVDLATWIRAMEKYRKEQKNIPERESKRRTKEEQRENKDQGRVKMK